MPRTATPADLFDELSAEFNAENLEFSQSDRQFPVPEWWLKLAAALDAAVQPDALETWQFDAATRCVDAYLKVGPDAAGRPSDELLRSWRDLKEAKPNEPKPREALAELLELPGMSHEQVTLMTGLSARLVANAAKALANRKAGAPVNAADLEYPDGWLTPTEKRIREETIARARRWKTAQAMWLNRPKAAMSEGGEWTPPPESVEELLSLPGMSIEQVAQMHRMTLAEVQAIKNGQRYVPSNLDQAEDELPQSMIEDEVRALHTAEPALTPAEIVERIGCGLTPDRVKAILTPAKKRK